MCPVDTLIPTATSCPSCGFECDGQAQECPRCQVVFDKLSRAEERREAAVEESREVGGGFSAERLALVDKLLVRQETERWEAFTGFEQANNYKVLDEQNNLLLLVSEESNLWARQFLKCLRPLTLHISTAIGEPMLSVKRPFRFYFQEVQILDGRGRQLGSVRKRWSLVNRRYTLTDSIRGEEYEIFGPFFRPWTFQIRRNGVEAGVILKKWSGALREVFTDADTFGIEFPREIGVQLKSVFLGAVFLIDFMHFEDNNSN